MNEDAYTKIVTDAVRQLGEHFDAVQVLVSFHESGATRCLKRGAGNFYARQGMAHEFIQEEQSEVAGKELARALGKDA